MAKPIKCSQCGEIFDINMPSNFKPFCSERCKLIDLGAWADGSYNIAAEESPMSEQITNFDESLSD